MLSLALWKLTLRGVLSDIPLDTGSAIVFFMMVAFVALIWLGSRGGSAQPRPGLSGAVGDSPAASRSAEHVHEPQTRADAGEPAKK